MITELAKKILNQKCFEDTPPILLDIGASGSIHDIWKHISKFCICIAFDADNREFSYLEKESTDFKKLYVVNSIVTDENKKSLDFYLTESPFCSSVLKPDLESLSSYSFSKLFEINKIEKINATNLNDILNELKINRIDWFKTDSQGIDLRLFNSLEISIRNKVLCAEFEPGIIDAYCGEDKLYEILKYMDNKNYFLSDFKRYGSERFNINHCSQYFSLEEQKYLIHNNSVIKTSPGWVELTYNNTLINKIFTERDFLLSIVFALIHEQLGFVLELCKRSRERFSDVLFEEIEKNIIEIIKAKIQITKSNFKKNKKSLIVRGLNKLIRIIDK